MMIEDRYYICRIRQFFQKKKSIFCIYNNNNHIVIIYGKKKQAKERVVGGVWVSGSVVYDETRVV